MSQSSKSLVSGHPQGLMTLFFSEMWERFCYYGMRVLLTLFLVKSLYNGDREASLIYGAYTALIYAAPVLGGRMADKFLGYRFAILLGAVLMAIGEFLMVGAAVWKMENAMLIGMGALIVGNGYFKANISTIVGKLYEDGDPRRDSGFTIFYIGINVGALLATTVVAYVGETFGFEYGFGLAGIGMLLGLLIFWTGRGNYAAAPGLEVTEAGRAKMFGLPTYLIISIASLILVPLCYFLISQNDILSYLLLVLFGYVAFSLISSGFKEGKVWGQRMIALVIFMLINIVFWACFEQAGTSLTLFADRNVSRDILGWEMPASMTQFFNPFFIILFGSVFSVMWVKLSEAGKNPSIPMKFALGILQLGLGFLITKLGFAMQLEGFLVPLWTLIILYLLHTTGELFLSPIGLSMVTKLSPKHIAGTAMGGWFLSFAIANFLGGQIATLTGAEGHGAEKAQPVEQGQLTDKTTVKEALEELGRATDFENWVPLDEASGPNVSFSTFANKYEWVQFRKSLGKATYGEWLNSPKLSANELTMASWLDEGLWNELRTDLETLKANDSNDEQAIDFGTWTYFKDGFAEIENAASKSVSSVFSAHQSKVMEAGLNKYTSVFSTLGWVLVGIAILIALLSKPLNKLMHGVS